VKRGFPAVLQQQASFLHLGEERASYEPYRMPQWQLAAGPKSRVSIADEKNSCLGSHKGLVFLI
jgi:hypothetical protein